MFAGQSVAVTGASGGIGRAIAEMFIANGAKVAISDLKSPEDVAAEIGALAFSCDVRDEAQIKAFIDAAESRHGPLDIFVANAGVGFNDAPGRHAAGGDNTSWETSWQVNVMQSIYAARQLLPDWIERGSGRFVVTASAAGLLSQVGSASYTATKHAALAFAESIAITHENDGVKVNCICPQYVKTNMTKGVKMAENTRDEFLEPSDVAQALKASIAADEFLVLPHVVVQKYAVARVMDKDAWISGMAKFRQKFLSDGKDDVFG